MKMAICNCFNAWTGKSEFFRAQAELAVILLIANFGDKWEPAYDRNENHNMTLYWTMQAILLIGAMLTWTHKPNTSSSDSNTVTFLSRGQTEEWKGWMQFAFIMYHYYRAWSAYNWIRVFVSSYVWMTGFGNFLYFDKKRDFTMKRMISMWIRINYFPIILSWATGANWMDDYYVVPLHTEGFFMTWITCRIAVYLEERWTVSYWPSRIAAIIISLIAHIAFFETDAVDSLLYFSDEMHFRFQADKYSALAGIVGGAMYNAVTQFLSSTYGGTEEKTVMKWSQRIIGICLIYVWYHTYGNIPDKHAYNPAHPYIFAIPMVGYLMLRNSSKYLCECHSTLLESLGKITLETYVLQFHLFMNHDVKFIPIVIPGSGPDGAMWLRLLNMVLCGTIFLSVSARARKVTISTQTTMTELMGILINGGRPLPQRYAPVAKQEEEETEEEQDDEATGDIEIAEKTVS